MTDLDARNVLQACLRRWYVMLPFLVIAAVYGYMGWASVKPVYYASSVVGARASNEQLPYSPEGRPSPRNGLLDIGGSDLILNLVVLGFDDPQVRARVVAAGGQPNFTARMFPSPPSAGAQAQLPLIMIEATEPSADSAKKTVELASAQVDPILLDIQRQASVPDVQMVKALRATPPTPVAGVPKRTKKFVLTLITGAALGVLAAVGVDILANRRQRRAPGAVVAPADGVRDEHLDTAVTRV